MTISTVQTLAAFHRALRPLVDEGVLMRGLGLVVGGAVGAVEIKGDDHGGERGGLTFSAIVQGGELYRVQAFVLGDGRMTVTCECRYFVDRGLPCKHAVALLLAATCVKGWRPVEPAAFVDRAALRSRDGGGGATGGRSAANEATHPLRRLAVPEPLRYGLDPNGGALRVFAPVMDASTTAYEELRPKSLRNRALDDFDRRVHAEYGSVEFCFHRIAYEETWVRLLARLVDAGRLHRCLDPGMLGPPVRWRRERDWSVEEHVLLTENGARRWARLVSFVPSGTGEPLTGDIGRGNASGAVIDVVAQAYFCLGNFVVIGDEAMSVWTVDHASPISADRRPIPAADPAMKLVRAGERVYEPVEVASLADELRHALDLGDQARRARGSRLVIDPRIGITFFVATPHAVIRMLPGIGSRTTVDLLPIARYRHPQDPAIEVDRDPRTHRIVDPPHAPAIVVPYGDRYAEFDLREQCRSLVKRARGTVGQQWRIARTRLPSLLKDAAKAGVAIELARDRARTVGAWSTRVTSGIDWLELDGEIETSDGPVALRDLVNAARRHPEAIEILPMGDGSTLVIPEALGGVVRRLASLLHGRDGEALRFERGEAMLLEVLLENAPHRKDDSAYRQLRDRLRGFTAPTPRDPPPGFLGTLRPYQRDGLGWLESLRDLRLGGCLADEMGLGKTVQVLALLAGRAASMTDGPPPLSSPRVANGGRRRRTAASLPGEGMRKPSLLVVPRSIVRNWIDEASRFAPTLRVIDLSQAGRTVDDSTFASCDVAIVTYGTLLRDIQALADRHFDYVIIDEAQAIKNESARTSKAVKCLRADHRLAITGTPIENHLGELWSMFEFINPAFADRCRSLAEPPKSSTGQGQTDFALVRAAVAPFILRRTKRDVAKDLPARIEQTVFCGMTEAQERHYLQLLRAVREKVRGAIDRVGLDRARLQVLEGLLRLRQAACHPMLADSRRGNAGSGKLEALMPMLAESDEERRKTLVFSQFTSFLAILRRELDASGICHEYLDGATRNRAARVRRFVEDEGCSIFLLSLKAGGVGLNLQAAERVILLDPWWNPAVEAQAIDRAHRIGQCRSVHALRLVAAGTIEEKVLALQERKRAVADAILDGSSGPLASLTREDLEALLADRPREGPFAQRGSPNPRGRASEGQGRQRSAEVVGVASGRDVTSSGAFSGRVKGLLPSRGAPP